MDMLKRFWQEEEGLAVVEILIIMAVLIVAALMFRNTIIAWVEGVLAELLPDVKAEPDGTPTPTPKIT